MKKLLLLMAVLSITACQSSQSTPSPELYAIKGTVVSHPECQDTLCRAVIKVDENVWHYDAVKPPVSQGDVVYKTCRYEPTREVCSVFWTSEPYVFYPSTTAKGIHE